MSKSIILIVVLAIVLIVLAWGVGLRFGSIFPKSQPKPPEKISLTYWSLWDDQSVIQPLIDEYEESNPNVSITFVKQSILNYRTRLQTQLRQGDGPDIFDLHNSWIPMFFSDLSSVNSPDMSDYYPVVSDSLVFNHKLYAMPMEIDGLVMFYNPDILQAAGLSVPTNWLDFMQAAQKVTVKDADTYQIQTAGAALGTTTNIKYWPETVGLLFLQEPNGDLNNPANQNGVEVLQFYNSFMSDPKNRTWDTTLPSDEQEFASGHLAFYFAPGREAAVIKQLNPNLNFKVAAMPQLPTRPTIGWGTFWVKGVSGYSKNSAESWKFLQFLSSDDNLKKLNDLRSQNGKPSLAYPKISMASIQKDDPVLGAVVSQGPTFKTWYLNSDTGDAGLNDEMVKVYKDLIDGASKSSDYQTLLQTAYSQIYQLFVKYQLTQAPKTVSK